MVSYSDYFWRIKTKKRILSDRNPADFSCTTARAGAVTLIQRFGSALNLNVHFHVLFLDGAYVDYAHGSSPQFRWVKAPTRAELT